MNEQKDDIGRVHFASTGTDCGTADSRGVPPTELDSFRDRLEKIIECRRDCSRPRPLPPIMGELIAEANGDDRRDACE